MPITHEIFLTLTKASVGLSNVDNTSDMNKPISTAVGIALAAKQDTLVSGTTIKTLNGVSLLGSGNITISASAGGSDKQVQFNDGGAFGGNSNLLFDKTNGYLGIGTSGVSPIAKLEIKGTLGTSAHLLQKWTSSGATQIGKITGDGAFTFGTYTNPTTRLSVTGATGLGLYCTGQGTAAYFQNETSSGTAYAAQFLGRQYGMGSPSGYNAYGILTGADTTNGINYGLKSYAYNGSTNYATYLDATGGTLNYALYIQRGNIAFSDANNVELGTTTGTKWGTATNQKQSWWNATPVVQQILATGASHTVDDVITLLQTYGLCRQS